MSDTEPATLPILIAPHRALKTKARAVTPADMDLVRALAPRMFAAMYKAVRQSVECLAHDRPDPFLGPGGAEAEMKRAHRTTGLDALLAIERRTMKKA